MTFRANSMTFKIDPARLEALPECRLREELNEFIRWFSENVNYMNPAEAAAGDQLIERMKEIAANKRMAGRYYADTRTSSDAGSQLSFFPSR